MTWIFVASPQRFVPRCTWLYAWKITSHPDLPSQLRTPDPSLHKVSENENIPPVPTSDKHFLLSILRPLGWIYIYEWEKKTFSFLLLAFYSFLLFILFMAHQHTILFTHTTYKINILLLFFFFYLRVPNLVQDCDINPDFSSLQFALHSFLSLLRHNRTVCKAV